MLTGLYKILLLLLPLLLWAEMLPLQMAPTRFPASRFPQMKILQSDILSFGKIDGEKFFGISALAYDAGNRRLFMLSDRSRLFAFAVVWKEGHIAKLTPLWGKRLRDRYGHKFFRHESDSEGMELVRVNGQKRLLISFEQSPRVMLFDLEGREVTPPLHKTLADLKQRLLFTALPEILRKPYSYRDSNKMLESVTYHPKFGMVTAPEFPLRKTPAGLHGIYNRKGLLCYMRRRGRNLAITELETLPDGNLLALERGVHLGRPLRIDLGLVEIHTDRIEKGICKSDVLFSVSTDEGWALDNFEGLTSVGDNRYLMISDDNDNFFQQTILVLFALNSSFTQKSYNSKKGVSHGKREHDMH